MAHAYRFGIEEEFFLADARTRGTPRAGLRAFHAAVRARLDHAEREQLQCQVEVASPPSDDIAEAREHLAGLRRSLSEIGADRGVLPFAAGTHPTARWRDQRPTDNARYHGIMADLRMLGRRNLVCGLHVHVEVPDPEARIGLINRLLPFLPVLLSLSVSSPFWEGRDTGLCGYRLCAFGELPRTGLPDLFSSNQEFERYVAVMTAAGAIQDASFLWWYLRPSIRYPTLELRIADACTRVEDAVAIAGLYRCLVRAAERRPDLNAGLDGVARAVIRENLWRAQRDGVRAALIDPQAGRAVPYGEALEAVLALVAEDAAALGCAQALDDARRIARDGTSADRQRAAYAAGRGEDGEDAAGIAAVVDALARETEGRA